MVEGGVYSLAVNIGGGVYSRAALNRVNMVLDQFFNNLQKFFSGCESQNNCFLHNAYSPTLLGSPGLSVSSQRLPGLNPGIFSPTASSYILTGNPGKHIKTQGIHFQNLIGVGKYIGQLQLISSL